MAFLSKVRITRVFDCKCKDRNNPGDSAQFPADIPLQDRRNDVQARMSGRKTLLFCAYNQFLIPHDVAGAILYSEAINGLSELDFDSELFQICTPSLVSFIDDADWFLAALRSMGHGDIADEFDVLNDSVREYVRENFVQKSIREIAENGILRTPIARMAPK